MREPRGRPLRGTKAQPRLRAAGTGPGRARAVNDGIEPPRLFIAPSPRRAGGIVGRRAALGGPAPTQLRPRRGPTDPGLFRSRRPRGGPGPLPSRPAPRYLRPALSCCSAVPRRGPAPPPPPPPPAAAHLPRARPLAPPPPRANRRARRRDVPPRPGPVVTPPPAARPLAAPARLRRALGARGRTPGARRRGGGSRREESGGWHPASGARCRYWQPERLGTRLERRNGPGLRDAGFARVLFSEGNKTDSAVGFALHGGTQSVLRQWWPRVALLCCRGTAHLRHSYGCEGCIAVSCSRHSQRVQLNSSTTSHQLAVPVSAVRKHAPGTLSSAPPDTWLC